MDFSPPLTLTNSGRQEVMDFLLAHPESLYKVLATFSEESLPPLVSGFRKHLATITTRGPSFQNALPSPPPETQFGQNAPAAVHAPSHPSAVSGATQSAPRENNSVGSDNGSNGDQSEHESEEQDMQLFEELEDQNFVNEVNYINIYGGGGGQVQVPVIGPGALVPDPECHRGGSPGRRRRRNRARPYEARETPALEDNPDTLEDDFGVDESRDNTGPQLEAQDLAPHPERQNLDDINSYLLTVLCSVAKDSMVNADGEAFSLDVHELFKLTLLGPNSSNFDAVSTSTPNLSTASPGSLDAVSTSTPNLSTPSPGSLDAVFTAATLCHDGETLEAALHLSQYVRMIEFVAQVQLYQRTTGTKYRTQVYEAAAEIAKLSHRDSFPNNNSLAHFYNIGLKAALLVAAGTPYILFLLSSAKLKSVLKKARGGHICALHKLIRCPDDSAAGNLIKDWLIPAIAQLRQKYPLSTKVLFTDNFVLDGKRSLPECLWDVNDFDGFIDNLKYETFIKERDILAWAPAMTDVLGPTKWNFNNMVAIYTHARFYNMSIGGLVRTLYQAQSFDASSPPSVLPSLKIPKSRRIWDNIVAHSNMTTISTRFDPALNKPSPFKKTMEARRIFTAQHRKYAALAKEASTENILRKKLQAQLSQGKRTRQNQYTLIDAKMFDGKVVKISDKNNDLVALLLANMPQTLRKNMMQAVELAFPDMVQSIDTSQQATHKFKAFHFSYYNRYAKQGTNTPEDVDPATVHAPGKPIIHTSLTTPRTSTEFRDNLDRVDQIVSSFQEIFEWIQQQLKILIPDTFAILEAYADILPAGDQLPMHPFTGFVVNLNVRTLVHRDAGDKEICLVFQFSEGEGGELGMVEPGLVFRLRSGDGVVFKSRDISHFNMDYVGKRVSFVFHTDASMELWETDRNHWQHNINMKCKEKNG